MIKFNQKEQVIRYMKAHGSISNLEATNELKIMSLSRRIADLAADGWVFHKEWEKGRGAGCTYAIPSSASRKQ